MSEPENWTVRLGEHYVKQEEGTSFDADVDRIVPHPDYGAYMYVDANYFLMVPTFQTFSTLAESNVSFVLSLQRTTTTNLNPVVPPAAPTRPVLIDQSTTPT
jgi:hypothetical protein